MREVEEFDWGGERKIPVMIFFLRKVLLIKIFRVGGGGGGGRKIRGKGFFGGKKG